MEASTSSLANKLTAGPGQRRRRTVNRIMEVLATAATGIAVAALGIVVVSVFLKGAGALNLEFLTKLPAPFGQAGGGIANAIVGTLVLVALATAMAVPVGILLAIYTSEFARPQVATVIRFALDILNGVPTIVTGIFIFGIMVVGHEQSGWAASVALAIVMLPIVGRSAQEVLALVPRSLYEAALALGLKRWRVVLRVVLPTALGGLITGAVLGVARVAGETAPLLFTSSVYSDLSVNLDPSSSMATIPMKIFTLSESPSPQDHARAWAAALLLIIFVLLLSVVARTFYERSRRRMRA
jgi:phosphate transport system permease protein